MAVWTLLKACWTESRDFFTLRTASNSHIQVCRMHLTTRLEVFASKASRWFTPLFIVAYANKHFAHQINIRFLQEFMDRLT